MIDLTTDPPKEDRETVIEKILISVGLTLFLIACVADPPPSMLPDSSKAEQTLPTNATETTAASSQAAMPSESNEPAKDEAGSSEPDTTAKAKADETPTDEESETDAETDQGAGKKGRSKPGRIVLKTVYDDKRVGADQSQRIEAELGLVTDEALLEYVRSIGIRLLRYAPPRPFDYEFHVVDQTAPNAFALPGGKIYISRGLLSLVESEDELAGVIGHEITHAAERHSAARIDYSRRLNPFSIGYLRAGAIAAYSREQESDADRGGQIMAAKAGYDPAGIARFLRKLDASERYEVGWSRLPNFLATHPTSPKRAALASDRAAGISWERQAGVAENFSLAYYSVIDGLILGDNPSGGLFEEGRFIHPELGFSIRFPKGWTTMNGQSAVAAISPSRDAQATLTVEGSGTDIAKVVDQFIKNEVDGVRVRIRERRRVQLGDLPAIRIEGSATTGLVGLAHQMTFVAHQGLVYRLSVVSYASSAAKYRGRGRAFAHSFRPLDQVGKHSLQVTRLRIARSLANETLQALCERTNNVLDVAFTGVMNDLYASTTLEKGTLVKIGLAEPFIPEPKEEVEDEAAVGAEDPSS